MGPKILVIMKVVSLFWRAFKRGSTVHIFIGGKSLVSCRSGNMLQFSFQLIFTNGHTQVTYYQLDYVGDERSIFFHFVNTAYTN